MPVLPGCATCDGRGCLRATSYRPRSAPRDRDVSAEIRLSCLRGVVVQAPAPARLVEGSRPTEATIAHVPVSKYADHLPLYRQARSMAGKG